MDTGVEVCLIAKPQQPSIRVAFNRLRRCPDAILYPLTADPVVKMSDENALRTNTTSTPTETGGEEQKGATVWSGRLRGHHKHTVEDALPQSGDM